MSTKIRLWACEAAQLTGSLKTRIQNISRALSLICIALILKMVISYQRNVEITYESFLPWFLRDGLFQRSAIQQILKSHMISQKLKIISFFTSFFFVHTNSGSQFTLLHRLIFVDTKNTNRNVVC